MRGQEQTPWFKARRYGYGAGMPIHRMGWLLLAAHIGATVLTAFALRPAGTVLSAIGLAVIALLPLPLYAARTEGGWRWRWGARD